MVLSQDYFSAALEEADSAAAVQEALEGFQEAAALSAAEAHQADGDKNRKKFKLQA